MKMLAIAAVLLTAPAVAQEVATWGVETGPGTQSSVRIIAVRDGAHVADISAVNRYVGGDIPDNLTITLWLDDVPFRVMVRQGPGYNPDLFQVYPPPGFVAVPNHVSVEEGQDATMLIFEIDGMPMG